MKKKIVGTIALAVLMSPSIAQRKYDKMPLHEVIESLGSKDYCLENFRECKIPYKKPYSRISGSKAEKARKISANLEARNRWLLENASKFKTKVELEKKDLLEKKEEIEEDFNDALEDLTSAFADRNEDAEKLEKLQEERKSLQSQAGDLNRAYRDAESKYLAGEGSKRDYEKARGALEELDLKNEELKDKIRRAAISAKSSKAEHEEKLAFFREKQTSLNDKKAALDAITQEMIDNSKITAKELAQELMDKQKRDLDILYAQKLVDDLEEDGDLAETLMRNMNDLENDLEVSANQSKLVQQQLKLKYDNSILKGLVDNQIASAITNKCPAIDACMKGQINELDSDIKDVEKAIPKDKVDGSSGTKK